MIRKILGILLVIGLIYFAWAKYNEEDANPLSDIPTEQEQRALEESQPEPDSVPENEMENQSPETAEQD